MKILKISIEIVIGMTVCAGVVFRFSGSQEKVYTSDEVRAIHRACGIPKKEIIIDVYNGVVVTAGKLRGYQRVPANKSLADTLHAASEYPEHPPLYPVLARYWMQMSRNALTPRQLSALLGVFFLPCLFWLCLELFRSIRVAWLAVALTAVSPYHILLSQNATQYTLFASAVCLSGAALLFALRTGTAGAWTGYALATAAGFYTHLFFVFVFLGQAIFMLFEERLSWSAGLKKWLIACAGGLALFIPWALCIVSGFDRMRGLNIDYYWSFSNTPRQIVAGVLGNLGNVFVDFYGKVRGARAVEFFVFIIIAYALYYFARRAGKKALVYLLPMIVITPVFIIAPNLISGKGIHYAQARYFLPSFLGIEIAVCYLFADRIFSESLRIWKKMFWGLVFSGLLLTGIVSCAIVSGVRDYDKGPAWSANLYIAKPINKAEKPLVVSNASYSAILGLSYLVKPETDFQLFDYFDKEQWRKFDKEQWREKLDLTKATAGYSDVFLVMPSPEFMDFVKQNRKFKVETVPEGKYRGKDGWIYRITKEKGQGG